MTDAAPPSSPAPRLESVFRHIAERRMAGVGLLNPALAVETVGFRPWEQDWLGVLITPWFMSLVCLPDPGAVWQEASSGTRRALTLPSGTYDFLAAHEDSLGPYLTSSLFSPMFEFADMEQAREVAIAVLAEVFSPQALQTPAPPAPSLAGKLEQPLSRRDFLGAFLGQNRS